MPNELAKEFFTKIVPYGSLGALGGVALQINFIRKGSKFKLGVAIANIFLSAWIGYVCGSLLPESIGDIKYSIISISGFLSYPILDFLEEKGFSLLLKKILGTKQ